MTYNIRFANSKDGKDAWPHRVDTVAAHLRQADILGLQEVTHGQLLDLEQRLPSFNWYCLGRDNGKKQGEYSPVFYRASLFSHIDEGTFWLSETPEIVGSKGWDAALPRVCSWVILKIKATGQTIWCASTHFDHRGPVARNNSGAVIHNKARAFSVKASRILMGDFNCLKGSSPYKNILAPDIAQSIFVDARQRSISQPVGPNSTFNGFTVLKPEKIIDHIFVSPDVIIHDYWIDNPKTLTGRFASDHLPVVVRVQIPKK
ncbi:MAG: endonuclease/exonuclease/phosphatase family protein [Pirellulales bacterium]